MDCSTPGFPVLHYVPEFAQTHVHWVDDTLQPSQPMCPPSPFAFSLSQHHCLLQWVGFSHQVAKVLKLQHQFSSVAQSYPTLCDSMDYNMPGSSVLHCLPEFTQIHVHSIGRWCYLIISSSCHPLLLLPSIFPSIRVFSNELAFRIRWPKYWSLSASASILH